MLFASIFSLSRYLREWTPSRPGSRIGFRQHVETFTAPCKLHYNQNFARCMKLLCLSNGHGEDKIAARILTELRKLCPEAELSALPIVGTGQAYRRIQVPIWGAVQVLPSGGFLNMDSRQFWRDLQGGLVGLTWAQWRSTRQWAAEGGHILAVGDLVPLLMARLSGASYAFVGTAKSEYYLRDGAGQILAHRQGSWEARTGGVYFPWERWLLQPPQCAAVFPRDSLTCGQLQKFGIPVQDLGNPMMDDVMAGPMARAVSRSVGELVVTLLPGSRPPEVYRNWAAILAGVESLAAVWSGDVQAIAAIDPSLDLGPLRESLVGWQAGEKGEWGECWVRGRVAVHFCVDRYADCLAAGEVAVAMAGTATEQFVGQGKAAFILPGEGPQFTRLFAERQRDLLGESIVLVEESGDLGRAVVGLLGDVDLRGAIGVNGRLRMGKAGAAVGIAEYLVGIWGGVGDG